MENVYKFVDKCEIFRKPFSFSKLEILKMNVFENMVQVLS